MLAVVLVISNHPVLGDPQELLLLATLQHSYDQDLLRSVIPPAWTLVIEVSFYVAMPLLLLAARRPLARFARRTRIAIVGTALVASVVATMWLHRYWLDPATQPHPDLRPFSFALPVWWDAFAFGMLAALAIAAGRGQLPLARELRYAALVPALAAWEYFGDPGVDRNTLFAGACALAIVGIAGTRAGARDARPRAAGAAPPRLVVVRDVPVAPADPVRARAARPDPPRPAHRRPGSGCP